MAEITKKPHDHNHDGDQHHDAHGSNPQVSHERRDVDIFQISAFGIGLMLACLVVAFAMWAMFGFLRAREDAKNRSLSTSTMLSERAKLPPEPRLQGARMDADGIQVTPKIELRDLRADEEAILGSYGWVDPNKGIVRIPIDLAIDMVAQKGLPSKPSPAGLDNDGFRMIPADSSSGRTLEKISQ